LIAGVDPAPRGGSAAGCDAPPPRWLVGPARLLRGLNRIALGVSMIALLAACAVLTAGVLLRYFLKIPTDWQDEVAVFLLVGAIFLCGGFVQQERGHVGIQALAGLLPPRLDALRGGLCDLAALAFCAFFSWKSWTLLREAWVEGQTTSSSWAPPLAIPYGLMTAGMVLLTLQLLVQLLARFGRAPAAR
jgi:TRAP-type C4-dicarboxylate transport system permease small subunit